METMSPNLPAHHDVGRKLTAIYITHAHPTTTSGSNACSTVPSRATRSHSSCRRDITAGNEVAQPNGQRFGGEALDNRSCRNPWRAPHHVVVTVARDQRRPSRHREQHILHIPSLAAVITGDVIYNGINPFLAASDPSSAAWIDSVDKVAALKPRIVIAVQQTARAA